MSVSVSSVKQAIQNFKEAHGDRYEFIKPLYTSAVEQWVVQCKHHGDTKFSLTALLKGQCCFACYGNKKKDIFEVIEEFKKVWGDTYNYSETKYVKNTLKVKINCAEHGYFWMKPSTHLKGVGCPCCRANEKYRMKTAESQDQEKATVPMQTVHCKFHGEFQYPLRRGVKSCPTCREMKAEKRQKSISLSEITSFDGLAALSNGISKVSRIVGESSKLS